MEKKLEVLAKVANILNTYNVRWAIGASALLYLNKISDHFNDLDIVLELEDVSKLKEAFKVIKAKALISKSSDNFKSDVFLQYNVDGVDIDVIAGFKIINDGKLYDCRFKLEDISGYAYINDAKIPLDNLDNWERYYNLMSRFTKAKMIKDYKMIK